VQWVSSPARPGPWRTPLVPHLPPMCAPSLSLSHFLFPHNNFPLPLFHLLCPRCDPVDGCRRSSDPEVSSPLLSSPSFPPSPCGPLAGVAVPARGPLAVPSHPPTRPRALPAQLARRGPNLAPGTRSPVPTRVALARATFKF
jgi:hypothetical protein